MKKIITILAAAVFASGIAIAQDKPGDKPEAKRGAKDNPEEKAGPRDSPEGARRAPTDEERNRRRDGKIFVTYDKDKSGTVTAEEMEAMREGKLNADQRKQIKDSIAGADKNKDGKLSLEEWFVYMENRRKPQRDREGGGRRPERDAPRDNPERDKPTDKPERDKPEPKPERVR